MNNKHLSPTKIIELRCNRIGSEDFRAAALRLRYAEHDGYRGTDLKVAYNLAQGLEIAVDLSAQGNHLAAAKQAGNCLYTLKRNRSLADAQNRKSLGSMVIECRDGNKRKLGDMVEWYISTHSNIAKQLSDAKEAEERAAMEQAAIEQEMLEFAESVAAGTAQLTEAQVAEVMPAIVKAA